MSHIETPPTHDGIDKPALGSIILAHAAVDMQTSSLVTLLPSLLDSLKLSYGTAAALVTMNQVVIAIAQPLFGVIGDKKAVRWLAMFGLALCGIAMAGVAFLPSYALVVVAVALSGIGSAIFHPEGLVQTRLVSGNQKTTGVSWFFLGGNIGFGVGPLLVGWLISKYGITGSVGLLVPMVLGCLLLAAQMRKFKPVAAAKLAAVGAAIDPAARKRVAVFVGLLLVLIVLRSVALEGMKTFMPLYFAHETGKSANEFAPLLTALSLAGIVGTIFSGPLADRIGRRAVMVGSMAVACAALFAFWRSQGIWQLVWIGVFGIANTAPWTISVTAVQDAMPGNLGLAGGLTLGTAYGAGGLGVGVLGLVADRIGLSPTLQIIALIPALVMVLSLFVPDTQRKTKPKAALREDLAISTSTRS